MMVHPAPMDTIGLAFMPSTTSSSSTPARPPMPRRPELGRNAADAFTVAQVAIGLLRQHLRQASIHGIVTDGGEAPNVVPGHTAGGFSPRRHQRLIHEARAAHRRCFEAGALATGASCRYARSPSAYETWRATSA